MRTSLEYLCGNRDIWKLIRRYMFFGYPYASSFQKNSLSKPRTFLYDANTPITENIIVKAVKFREYTSVRCAIKYGYLRILQTSTMKNQIVNEPLHALLKHIDLTVGNKVIPTISWLIECKREELGYCLASTISVRAVKAGNLDVLIYINRLRWCIGSKHMQIAIERFHMPIVEWLHNQGISIRKYGLRYDRKTSEEQRLELLMWTWKSCRTALSFRIVRFLTFYPSGFDYFLDNNMLDTLHDNDECARTEFLRSVVTIPHDEHPINLDLLQLYQEKYPLSMEYYVNFFVYALRRADRSIVEFLWKLGMKNYYENREHLLLKSLQGRRILSSFPIVWLSELSPQIHDMIVKHCFVLQKSIKSYLRPTGEYHQMCSELKNVRRTRPYRYRDDYDIHVFLDGERHVKFKTLEYYLLLRHPGTILIYTRIFLLMRDHVLNEHTFNIIRYMYHECLHGSNKRELELDYFLNLISHYFRTRSSELFRIIKWMYYNMLGKALQIDSLPHSSFTEETIIGFFTDPKKDIIARYRYYHHQRNNPKPNEEYVDTLSIYVLANTLPLPNNDTHLFFPVINYAIKSRDKKLIRRIYQNSAWCEELIFYLENTNEIFLWLWLQIIIEDEPPNMYTKRINAVCSRLRRLHKKSLWEQIYNGFVHYLMF